MHAKREEQCFLCFPFRGVKTGQSLELSSVEEYSPEGEDVGTEDKKSPLVGSITRQRLVEAVTD
jgi:hypothetical protein